jgi:hypothetical protein
MPAFLLRREVDSFPKAMAESAFLDIKRVWL